MAAEGPSSSPLELLLTVQDLDTVISQLEHRRAALPERERLAETDASLVNVDRRLTEAGAEREELSRRQADLEAQIAAASSRRTTLEQRMYSARGSSPRDLQAMDDEIKHLRARGSELEDAELEVMVAAEPLDEELGTLTAERERLLGDASALRHRIGETESSIDAELAEHSAQRQAAAEALQRDLLDRYEALRARLGGTGAARLIGTRCSGCHLELPAMEVDRIRRLPPGTVVTCEQCGRILVPGTSSRESSTSPTAAGSS